MVPDITVINVYIRHERRDYQARVAAAELGQIVPRTLPSIDRRNTMYYRFILNPRWGTRTPITSDRKIWGGEPTVAIIKAIAGLGQPIEERTIDVAGGVVRVGAIEHVRIKFNELIRVWSRPPPRVSESEAGGKDDGGGTVGDSSGRREEQEQGKKRKRGEELGRLAPKGLLLEQGGHEDKTRIVEWLENICPGSVNERDEG